jgi:hypothetical protein
MYSMVGRIGSGFSSYIAILSDVTVAIVPMIIFATFSLIAGVLVLFLPETKDIPLPETFRDALMFTESTRKYPFYEFEDDGKSSVSVVAKEGTEDESNVVAEDKQQSSKEASVPRRTDTFTELAPISEVHEEDPERPKSSLSTTPTQEDFSVRKRHAAGSFDRKVSNIHISSNDAVDEVSKKNSINTSKKCRIKT